MRFLSRSVSYQENPQIGKTRAQLDAEIREVAAETRKRVNNRLDIEDQQARTANLKDAKNLLN